MKIVFDTNILISATLWEGSVAQKVLFKLIQEDTIIYTSKEILEEYKKVLKRDFKYTEQEVETILEKILLFVQIIEPSEKLDIIKADPEDNKILECAVASKAEYILSYDKKHLLILKEFQGILILTPEQFLKIT
ncbi:MAG TPA: putative toxin-antitoxin system toxin component, PIN family [Candidatus Nanoarchaeia archaeon]|nr:putative toxin-antitoxin system toxin component, PIN family [Candidatus Nanoarchaeia archaeon]